MRELTAPRRQTALRKAAILVSTLDRQSADALLDRMGPDGAARVRNAVLALGDVTTAEQQAVMSEFLRAGSPAAPRVEDGVELDESLARRLSTTGDGPPTETARAPHAGPAPRFQALQFASADSVARHLRREHPQVIAVVLAHLEPERAAEIIRQLPERTQVDVLRRVAELDAADPQVLRDLEAELEHLLADEIRAARNRSAGLSLVASILEAAGSEREELLRTVSHHDERFSSLLDSAAAPTPFVGQPPTSGESPRTQHDRRENPAPQLPDQAELLRETSAGPAVHDSASEAIAGPTPAVEGVSFEELIRLDDSSLARLLEAADPEVALIALSGGSEAMIERVSRQLSRREARMLRNRLQSLGALRLADIAHAQQRLAELSAQLARQGLIRLPSARRFAVAA